MKVRVANGSVRYRLDPSEADSLMSGDTLTVTAHEALSFLLRARDVPEPVWTMSGGTFTLDIPRSEVRPPTPDSPTIYSSDTYIVELDIRPNTA